MKEINLTRGKVALVDDDDYVHLSVRKWYARKAGKPGNELYYAATHDPSTGNKIRMHRLIMDAPEDMQVDHVDGDGLNNQRVNLRLATKAENMRNQGPRKNNKCGLKGVKWSKKYKKWVSQITFNRKVYYVGGFSDPNIAAAAYSEMAKKLHGEFSRSASFPRNRA